MLTWLLIGLILLRWLAQAGLGWLNRRHVVRHADEVPQAFVEVIDRPTYQKSVAYTLAKSRLAQVEYAWDSVLLLILLFSGVLPWAYHQFLTTMGGSVWSMGGFVLAVGVALSVLSLPLDWYAQFRLEERFGFNTTTMRTWWADRAKGFLLALGLGFPLLVLILKLVDWAGAWWWLWAWGVLVTFQITLALLAPVLILPLFNKFTPLPEGSLRERLRSLAARTGFQARGIQIMDGSKRSRHSNAFFTGFGRFRRIVLFDTLIQQLSEPELEAVLAHEIGHYKRKHIHKMTCWSIAMSLGMFFVLSVLARQEWFYRTFGFAFAPGEIVPALLLFGLLGGMFSFWFSPLAHYWSRRFEYEADAFAAKAVQGVSFLVSSLRKLNEKNLSNLTPHPWYSRFYYSHPTLLERESALRRLAPNA